MIAIQMNAFVKYEVYVPYYHMYIRVYKIILNPIFNYYRTRSYF